MAGDVDQGAVYAAAWLEERGQEAAVAELRDVQVEGAGGGVERAGAATVALVASGADVLGDPGLVDRLGQAFDGHAQPLALILGVGFARLVEQRAAEIVSHWGIPSRPPLWWWNVVRLTPGG